MGLGNSVKSNTKVTEGGKKTIQQQARGRHGLKTVVRFNFRPERAQNKLLSERHDYIDDSNSRRIVNTIPVINKYILMSIGNGKISYRLYPKRKD